MTMPMLPWPLRRSPSFIAAGALALLLGAGDAGAFPITIGAGGPNPFTVDPLYFVPPTAGNPSPYGLVGPGDGVDYDVRPTDYGISACGAGGGCALSISISLVLPEDQNPQHPAGSLNPQTVQGTPTTAVPFVGESVWTVQNTTGTDLAGLVLLFTSVDFSGGYPFVDVALDQNLYTVVRLNDGVTDWYYGALAIGSLAAGQSTPLRVRYIVSGELKDVGGTLVMPPLGVAGLVVPEPGTSLLVGVAVAVLAAARRRQCG